MLKKILPLILMLSMCSFGIAFASELNKIVAVVNGEMITLHDLRNNTAAEMESLKISPTSAKAKEIKQAVLDKMIDNILFRQEAERYKVVVSDAEIEAELKKLMQGGKVSPAEFEAQLLRQGTTLPLFKEQVRNSILKQRLINNMVSRKIIVSDEDINAFYKANSAQFTEKLVDFSFMVFDKSTDAPKIFKQIKSGNLDFAAAAKEYSVDSSASNGGVFSNIPLLVLPVGMQQALMRLKVGQMSDLIPLEDKKGLLRLNKIHQGQALPLERVRQSIETQLREERTGQKLKEFSDQLRSRAVIDVRL